MYFQVLGPVELRDRDGAPVEISADKQRRLLAALLLRANTWVSSDYLVDAVWPDNAPKSTGGNVKTYIHHLRGVVLPHGTGTRIESRRGAYRLRLERHECDATVFEDRIAAATGVLARTQPAAAVEQLKATLELWRGDPYGPLTGAEVDAEAERLGAMLWHARYNLAETLSAAGRAGEAITFLWPLAVADPLREKTWEHLLCALSEDGRWAEVLVAFQRARQVLAEELGIMPGPALQRLHQLALCANEQRQRIVTQADPTDALQAGEAVAKPPAPGRTHSSPWRKMRAVRRRKWPALLLVMVASAWIALNSPTSPNHAAPDTATPTLTFLAPSPGQVVRGVVTLRVKVTHPAKLQQVDFHQLTSRCPDGGTKNYIGMDTTPTATGVYQISFDTRLVSNGCLDFGAVGLDRDNEKVLYPTEGTYVPTTVNN